jgi:hypothetical protein
LMIVPFAERRYQERLRFLTREGICGLLWQRQLPCA